MSVHIRLTPDKESKAETIVREQVLAELRQGDAIISGLRFHDHEYGDVEIDLLVLLPDAGAAVVEIKGGVVSYAKGAWWTTGSGPAQRIDPPGQARRGLHSFRRFIERQPNWSRGRIYGDWFLAFPFTDIPAGQDMGPEGRRESIFGRGEEAQLLTRVASILKRSPAKVLPASGWVEKVVEILQAQGREPISLEQRVSQHSRDISDLTEQQTSIVKMWRSNRFIEVVGGAGSGKTWLAMEQARQWQADGLSVAFLTYTKGVAEMVCRTFGDQPKNQKRMFIGTFHALGYSWGVTPNPEHSNDQDYWTEALPLHYLDAFAARDSQEKFDAVVVDEAQDFADFWWDVVISSARDPDHLRLAIFRDDGQAMFEGRRGRPDLPMAKFDLDSNLRNGRQVVETFAPLSPRKMVISGGEGFPTRIIFAEPDQVVSAADNAVESLVDREGWLPEQVALLTTKGKHPEHARRQNLDKDRYWQELWSKDDVFYGTVAGFKGLERPAIVVAINGFHDHADPKDVLYTAISRAIDLAILVGTEVELTAILGAAHLRRLLRRQAHWQLHHA